VTVERTRFDDVDEPDEAGLVGYEYHGWHLIFRADGYELRGVCYDDEPDIVTVSRPPDPPRQGFGEEIPYDDPRFARAVTALVAASKADRAYCKDCGSDGSRVSLDLGRLAVLG
jgi:hypothetical protein